MHRQNIVLIITESLLATEAKVHQNFFQTENFFLFVIELLHLNKTKIAIRI